MTDEKLIEAAKAIHKVAMQEYPGMDEWRFGWEQQKDRDRDVYLLEAHAAFSVFEKAHAPTGDEREALRVASPNAWGWGECVVCGSKDVTDRGMVFIVSKADGAYVGRIAWCDGSQECRDDLRQAGASMLTEDQAEAVDAALRRPEVPEPSVLPTFFAPKPRSTTNRPVSEPQGEPTPINGKWVCGKCAREVLLGHDDGQIPEHHRTCPKRAQGEPTDTQA